MDIIVRELKSGDVAAAAAIWNEVVEGGVAFPQVETLSESEAAEFFASQSRTAVAQGAQSGELLGLYILHPNNVGRCAHIANASYAVKSAARGRHIGEALVRDCLERAKELGFRIMQFNAVVSSNASALHLYEKLGFERLGVIPGGFRMKDGSYCDIIPHYRAL